MKVIRHQIDLKDSSFKISRATLIKIIFRCFFILPLPFIALYFKQFHMVWFSILIAVFIIMWQIFAYGFWGDEYIDTHVNTDVKKFYGKKTLIFVGVLWFLVIVALSILLYLKLP